MSRFFIGVGMDEVQQAKQRRLYELEKQQARMGIETPPHISNEIADLRGEVQRATRQAHAAGADGLARLNQLLLLSLVGSSCGFLMSLADFVLILVLRGKA